MSLLEVIDVHTYYGDSHILHGVSISADPGKVTAVVGRNGVGKTTLMRTIIGFTPPRSGRVVLDGREIHRLPTHQISRLGIGLVPQGRRVFGSLTVLEHLRVAARKIHGSDWDIDAVFELFPRLRERMHHYASNLSGGEQQMLAIGRALMMNPRVLLMDEPSEGLAPLIVDEVERTIARLARSGLAIVLVEQRLPLALRLADQISVLSKGTVVFSGSPDELARNEELRIEILGVGKGGSELPASSQGRGPAARAKAKEA